MAEAQVDSTGFTGLQKLAALLILLGEDSAALILKSFDDNERELVCAEMANLPMLGLDQQQTILKEFTEMAVEANSALGGSVEYTRAVLEKAVGLFKTEEIIGRVSMSRTSVPAMQTIIDMEANGICNLIKDELPQTIALVVSYLTPQKAGEVLMALGEATRESVVERLANLASTPIEVVETLGAVLSRKVGTKITRALNQTGGVQSAAAMLNAVAKENRQDILNNMDERVPDLVRSIRAKMFTFDDLGTLEGKDLQKIMAEVPPERLAVALSAATENVKEKLLGAVSKRAAENVTEEIENMGKVKLTEITVAQEAVVDIVRRMDSEGEISLD